MDSQIKTILFDFRLTSIPTEEDVIEQIVNILESQSFSKSEKFSKLSQVKIAQRKPPQVQTYIFESEDSNVFVTIRVYDKTDTSDHVLLTLLIELTS